MKLCDVPIEFAELERALVESAGELSPELEQRFDTFLRAGKDKIEAAAMVVRGFEMEAEACQQEAKRLGQRSALLEKNAARLKRLILCALDSAFAGKVKTPLFTILGPNLRRLCQLRSCAWRRAVLSPRKLRPRQARTRKRCDQANAQDRRNLARRDHRDGDARHTVSQN